MLKMHKITGAGTGSAPQPQNTQTMSNSIETAQLRTIAFTHMTDAKNLDVAGYLNSYNKANTVHMQYKDGAGDLNIVDIHVTENMCSVRHIVDGMKSHYQMTTFTQVVQDLNKLAKGNA
jgi:hypothetical protein